MKKRQAKIKSFDNKKIKTKCLGCEINSGKVEFSRGLILKTENFEAHQDYEIPISGFIIISSKKHIHSISELSQDKMVELAILVYKIRVAMKNSLKIKKVCIFQNENSEHHFHIWIFPFHKWMEKFGNKINSIKPVMNYAKNNLKTKNNILKVKKSINILRNSLN